MTSGRWVAYVGPFLYPSGEAASLRVRGVANALATGGRDVVVVSGSSENSDTADTTTVTIGGGTISHVAVGERPPATSSPLQKAWRVHYEWGKRTVAWLNQQPTRPSHVILYGGLFPFGRRMLSWSRANDVPLVVDVVEWYSPKQLRGGALGPEYLSSQLAHHSVYARADGIIAISTLLAKHYNAYGIPTVRVPPTFDVADQGEPVRAREDDSLRLVYFGTAGRKDLLKEIVDGFELAEVTNSSLTIVGVTELQLERSGLANKLGIRCRGKIPQEAIGPMLQQEADYTVLLRPNERYAHAGFPTKVVESLVNGVPVICNLTSDLTRYIDDGGNGVVVHGSSAEAFARAVRKASSLQQQLPRLKAHARRTAVREFDYRGFVEPLGALFDAVSLNR